MMTALSRVMTSWEGDVQNDVLGGDLVGHRVDVRDDDVQTGSQGFVVFAQALHHVFVSLGDDADPQRDGDNYQNEKHPDDEKTFHDILLS